MRRTLKNLVRRFGIDAPRLAVRPHMPWYWRWCGVVAGGVLVAGVAWFTYDFGLEYAGFRQGEATRLRAQLDEIVRQQQIELAELNAKTAAAERQLQIERATYGDLARQVKSLAQENATLKEDLAFFQSLTAATGKEGAVSVNRFRLMPETVPGEYRYQLLLVQTGERAKEFNGRLQFVLNLQQDGRKVVLMLPQDPKAASREYQVSFKLFQRVEGMFRIAPNAVVKGLQVRVFEGNSEAPKLTHNVTIS
ncbi:MAG: hypothetical protein K2X06_13985 [Burkholderiales bacterium]|nr:hypothetical protein [Burkholderiales bacterium]